MDAALVDMTGGMAERLSWSDASVQAQVRSGAMWTRLLDYHNKGCLLGAGSPSGASDREVDAVRGIVQSHAYSILQVVEVDSYQLIQRMPAHRTKFLLSSCTQCAIPGVAKSGMATGATAARYGLGSFAAAVFVALTVTVSCHAVA